MVFEPRGARVLVEPLEKEAVTPGGIHLPDTAQKVERQGVVRKLGTAGNVNGALDGLRVGYRIAYSAYAGTEIKIDDRDMLILDADHILGVWCSGE